MTYEEWTSLLPGSLWIGGVRFRVSIAPDSRREEFYFASYISDGTGRKLPLRANKIEPPWSTDHLGALLSGARQALDGLEGIKSAQAPPGIQPAIPALPATGGLRPVAIPVADAGVCVPCNMVYGGVSDSLCPACGEMLLPMEALMVGEPTVP